MAGRGGGHSFSSENTAFIFDILDINLIFCRKHVSSNEIFLVDYELRLIECITSPG